MAAKKTKPKKSSIKKSKKVEVVFQDSDLPKKDLKVTKKPSKVSKKTVNKTKKDVSHKNQTHTTKTHHKTHSKPSKKQSKKKDYVVIGILSILIVALVVLAFFVPNNGVEKDNDVFKETPSSQEDVEMLSLEEFENLALELNLDMLKDMKEYQLNILSENYEELSIDAMEMEYCLLDNDYLLKDANLFDYEKIELIQNDFLLAQQLNISSTPSVYVNGYLLSGFVDFETFTDFIDSVSSVENLSLDYTDKSFENLSDDLKLYYITDTQTQEIYENNLDFVDFLKNSDTLVENVNDLFTTVYNQADVEYVHFSSDLGKDILQTIEADTLPALYLQGDVSSLDFNLTETSEIFSFVFEDTLNGKKISKDILMQLTFGSNYNQIFKVLDYNSLINENDVVIGSLDADVSIVLFTDYDCPFCKQFEEETLTDAFFEEYIDSGKANLVIKPMVTNDIFSILPILFLKCSEDQGSSLQVHKKIFELSPVIGVQTVYDLISLDYAQELEYLEDQYNRISSSMEGN